MRNLGRVVVVCFTGNSGLTDYSVSLCSELARLAPVEFLTASSYDPIKYGAREFTPKSIFRRTRHYAVDVIRLLAYLLRTKPAAVVFQSWLKWPSIETVMVKLLRLRGIRVFVTVHDLLPHVPRPWSENVLKLYYRHFTGLIVHSERQKAALLGMVPNANALVVPHGVYNIFRTREPNRATSRRALGLPADTFAPLFFGHLEERKGLLEFIAAGYELDPGKFTMVIAGAPDGNPRVRDALNRAKLHPTFHVSDHAVPHHDVQDYFAACDVVVLPYREGTTSGVLKLALAFGRPVICSDVGDFRETLDDWSGRLLQGSPDPTTIRAAILEMSVSPSDVGDGLSSKYAWGPIAAKYHEFLMRRVG